MQPSIYSFPIEVHGNQQGSNYNGYYGHTAYHPLVASISVAGSYNCACHGNRIGNGFIHAILRKGSVHTAKGASRFVRGVVTLAKQMSYVTDFRMDAGYTTGSVMDEMTDGNVKFVGSPRGNTKLDDLAAPYVSRLVGRPPAQGYEYNVEFRRYQVDTWKHEQCLILVVVGNPDSATGQLNLMPHYFFLITNWGENERTAEQFVEHYRERGTFEGRLGEFSQAIGANLSSQSLEENECTMLIALLVFNLANIVRSEHENVQGSCKDLERFQSQVRKAGALVLKHSRQLIVRVADSVRYFWKKLNERFSGWKLPARLNPNIGANRRRLRPPPRHAYLTEVLRP
jgi:hypothetical protein